MGERTPEGRGSSLWTPFSGGVVWGEVVLLTGYLACGPHTGRPVTARPPAGRAGDVGRYPLGEGREEPFGFPLSPPVNKPLLPPARAGGRAMRRWSWRPQARYADRKNTPRLQQSREKGCGGKKLFPPRGPGAQPLVLFPPFLQRNGAPPGRAKFLPFQRRRETPTSPPPGRQPLPSISTVPGQTAPDRQTAGFPLGKPAVAFCHGISAQALARNFSSRSSPSLMFSMDTAKDHRT